MKAGDFRPMNLLRRMIMKGENLFSSQQIIKGKSIKLSYEIFNNLGYENTMNLNFEDILTFYESLNFLTIHKL